MQLPAPRTSRSLFELFELYDPARGLDHFLTSFDVADIEPRHIYNAVLDRQPETLRACRKPADYDARVHLRGALNSPEFQRRIIPLLLNAYPEKRRLIFVHVPKCAGTDLEIGLSARYPSIGLTLAQAAWTSRQQLFETLRRLSRGLRLSDTILVHGHLRLVACVNNRVVRPADRIITVIRDPVEIILSNINYIFTRILDDQEADKTAPDTDGWKRVLGIDRLPPEMPADAIAPLLRIMLHDRTIAVPNSLCHWLGDNDAKSAIMRLAINNVEITDTRHYTAWARSRWGITHKARANQSRKFVTVQDITEDDLAFVADLTAEDRELHGLLVRQIDASGKDAVFAGDLDGVEQYF